MKRQLSGGGGPADKAVPGEEVEHGNDVNDGVCTTATRLALDPPLCAGQTR